MFIHGSTGTGKSRATLCLVDRVEHAKFYGMLELVNLVNDFKKERLWNQKEFWDTFARYSLVVIDDVGLREVSDDFQMETLYQALEAREGKPLVCTSNLSEKRILTSYNDRIHSRLCRGTIFEMGGTDRRLERE